MKTESQMLHEEAGRLLHELTFIPEVGAMCRGEHLRVWLQFRRLGRSRAGEIGVRIDPPLADLHLRITQPRADGGEENVREAFTDASGSAVLEYVLGDLPCATRVIPHVEEPAETDSPYRIAVEAEPEVERQAPARSISFLALAALFVVFVGIAAILLFRHNPNGNESPVAVHDKPTESFQVTASLALLSNPLVHVSRTGTLGTPERETGRRYEDQTLFVAYGEVSKDLSFVFVPLQFQTGKAELLDDTSRANIAAVAAMLKDFRPPSVKVSIEVHERNSDGSTNVSSLSNGRAQKVRRLLERAGVAASILGEAKGFGSKYISQLADIPQAKNLDPIVLLIRQK